MAALGDLMTVHKLDYASDRVLIAWSGSVVECRDQLIALQAVFQPKSPNPPVVDGVPLCQGDVFTEYYYLDRWYNVFHIADARGSIKGWYCNAARPPAVSASHISFVDLALDLFVHPDGHYTVLDEDEFAQLAAELYRPEDVAGARSAIEELIVLAHAGLLPSPRDAI
ncbi:MAG TPA: DUF402 domain-containing protein [Chloroflexota bacterium]|nr:DUF402 domain-containing protein [Chloroflexota bacterium]